jgi:hypothetical protein
MFFVNVRSSYVHERFWSMVEVVEKIRCWKWRGGKDAGGYGQFRMNGQTIRSPRVAFFLRNGVWPNNACHRCDNPSCCNPDHIFDGTRSDNMRDMVSKGRNKTDRGERHGRAVLNNEKVLAIRAQYKEGLIGFGTLAKRFNCSPSTIQRVINRKNWAHV